MIRKMSEDGDYNRILIGVTGGSAAGKTTLCENIVKQMALDGSFKVQIIALDSFYKGVDKTKIDIADYNFDHPHALDFDAAHEVLLELLKGKKAKVPRYCFVTHSRLPQFDEIKPTDVIIFEGILAFYDSRIRDLMKYKIFMHCDDDIRLCRRLKRDVEERGRSIEGVLFQYNRFVKEAYTDYILPTIRYADLIVPGSRSNKVSVDFIVQHMKNLTKQMQFYKRALTTKIYFYGEVVEAFLSVQRTESFDYYLNNQQNNTEFVFANGEQNKKELDLFMSNILGESFTVHYYKQVFIHQFIRILGSFVNRILGINNFKLEDIEFLPACTVKSLLNVEVDKVHRIKVVFLPHIKVKDSQSIIQFRQKLRKQDHLIIANIFVEHYSIRKLMALEKTIFVNLFCIANEHRFQEVLQANKRDDQNHNFKLLEDEKLLNRAVSVLITNIKKFFENDDF